MLVATELPIRYQGVLAALTDYDFVIAPVCLKFMEYRMFNAAQRRKGRFVVLDNGTFEGELLEVEKLLDLVKLIHPQEVIAPDIIGNREETVRLARDFCVKLRNESLFCQVQVCPQGNSFEDWLQCYQELVDLPQVSSIGVSYVGHFEFPEDRDYFGPDMAPEETIRLRFFHYLVGRGLLRGDKRYHLLGLYSPSALSWYARYPFIRSIDTSFPIVCALRGDRMDEGTRKPPGKLDYNSELTDEALALAVRNVLWMKEECNEITRGEASWRRCRVRALR